MTNRFFELMKLAFRRTFDWTHAMFWFVIGTVGALVIFGLFFLAHYASYGPEITQHVSANEIDSAVRTAIYLSMLDSAGNVFCMFIFAAIVAILGVYTYEFVYLCYIFDNRSWDIINIPRDWNRRRVENLWEQWDRGYLASLDAQIELEDQIDFIKSGNEIDKYPLHPED